MDKSGLFDKLAEELNLDERTRLLEKLKSQSNLQNRPLYEERLDDFSERTKSRYESLPWYKKLLLGILSFFKGCSLDKLYQDYLMSGVVKTFEKKVPNIYNYSKDLLLPRFQELLIYLRDNSRFFYTVLDASLNQNRGGLFVFLGSLEMQEMHALIEHAIDPAFLLAKFPGISKGELRKKAHRAIEDALTDISAEQKAVMYLNACSLNSLKQLSAFHFDRMINVFSPNPAYQGKTCPGVSIRDQLLILNNILNSMREPPSMTLLSSLFVFILSGKRGEGDFDIQTEMKKLLLRAEISIEAIRDFNREIPLTMLLRCMSRDRNISPMNISGGEDWFAAYKEHWKKLADEKYFNFIRTKRQNDMQDMLKFFFKGAEIKMLENMESASNPTGIPVKGGLSLSYIQTFYQVVFMKDINKIVNPIFIDGEFEKKENRLEFAEYYNNLTKADDFIKSLDRKLDPQGDYGKRYFQAKEEMTQLSVKRKKTQVILDEVYTVTVEIVRQTTDAMRGMIKVLDGIVNPNENYDTLSNIELVAKEPDFYQQLTMCIELFKTALNLMENIDALEAEK